MRLAVLVAPKSGRDEVVGWRVGADGRRELLVRVAAAPEKGKATAAACKALASYLGVPKSSVRCARGQTSHHKIFELPVDEAELERMTASLPSGS